MSCNSSKMFSEVKCDESLLGKLIDTLGAFAGQKESEYKSSCFLSWFCHSHACKCCTFKVDSRCFIKKALNCEFCDRINTKSDQVAFWENGSKCINASSYHIVISLSLKV